MEGTRSKLAVAVVHHHLHLELQAAQPAPQGLGARVQAVKGPHRGLSVVVVRNLYGHLRGAAFELGAGPADRRSSSHVPRAPAASATGARLQRGVAPRVVLARVLPLRVDALLHLVHLLLLHVHLDLFEAVQACAQPPHQLLVRLNHPLLAHHLGHVLATKQYGLAQGVRYSGLLYTAVLSYHDAAASPHLALLRVQGLKPVASPKTVQQNHAK
mmetsp:Transcript_27524/g.52020  ORF Transcript_27524/g.52020 Transcript_27524/m.52020 type:complete len:214 (+) Transcript_27524:522-1163(+)